MSRTPTSPPERPAAAAAALSNDIYGDDQDFRELLREALEIIDSESAQLVYDTAAGMVTEAIGRDATKLHALIDVVHVKIVSRRAQAFVSAVQFYRAVSSRLHEEFYTPSDLEQEDTGATAAVRSMTEKCAIEIERECDWTSPGIIRVLDFVEQAFRIAKNLVSATATCDIIARMAESAYLFFNHNLVVFKDFCFRVVPRINAIVPADELIQVNDVLALVRSRKADAPRDQAHLIDELLEALGVGGTPNGRQVKSWEQDLNLFASEPDWSRQAINFTIKKISDGMRIDASASVQENTYSVIEATVSSRMVFHGHNLNALAALLIRVGPALDAMSESVGPSKRLTKLLNLLKASPKSRTLEQQENIDGLFEVLGRRTSSREDLIAG